jgi:hypothetical protein
VPNISLLNSDADLKRVGVDSSSDQTDDNASVQSEWEALVLSMRASGQLKSDIDDSHEVQYTPAALVALFESVGFRVSILEHCNGAGSAAPASDWSQNDGPVKRCRANGLASSIVIDAMKPATSVTAVSGGAVLLVLDFSIESLASLDSNLWINAIRILVTKIRKRARRLCSVIALADIQSPNEAYQQELQILKTKLGIDRTVHRVDEIDLAGRNALFITASSIAPSFSAVSGVADIIRIHCWTAEGGRPSVHFYRQNMTHPFSYGIDIDLFTPSSDYEMLSLRRKLAAGAPPVFAAHVARDPYVVVYVGDSFEENSDSAADERLLKVIRAVTEAIRDGFDYRGATRRRRVSMPWVLIMGSYDVDREPFREALSKVFWAQSRRLTAPTTSALFAGALCVVYSPVPRASINAALLRNNSSIGVFPVLAAIVAGCPVIIDPRSVSDSFVADVSGEFLNKTLRNQYVSFLLNSSIVIPVTIEPASLMIGFNSAAASYTVVHTSDEGVIAPTVFRHISDKVAAAQKYMREKFLGGHDLAAVIFHGTNLLIK